MTEKENKYKVFSNEGNLSNVFLVKVFLFFGIELLLTALLTYGISYLFNVTLPINDEANMIIYLVITIVSMIGLIISSIFILKKTLVDLNGGIIPTIIFIVCMSVLLSSLSFYIGIYEVLPLAVLISSVLFFIMCAFGLLFKGRLGWLIALAIGLLVSAGVIALITIFLLPLMLFGSYEAANFSYTSFYIAEWILLIYSAIITIIDVNRLKQFAANNEGNNALAIYFSISLYNDFILILLRVIFVLLRNRNNN